MTEYVSDYCPRLRWPLDIQQVGVQGQNFALLRDPLGVAADPAIVPLAVLPIISRFDGVQSIASIAKSGEEYGVTVELVAEIAAQLGRMGFLADAETEARWAKIRDEFRRLEIRPAVLAGKVYPSDARELQRVLENYIEQAGVPSVNLLPGQEIAAMICPHIDYQRGWRTYAAAYSILSRVPKPDVIVMFGTCHQPAEGPFVLTNKRFDSPFGIFEPQRDILRGLVERLGEQVLGEEIVHRTEHSLELQLPMLGLRYLYEDLPPIVPVLVGSFAAQVERGEVDRDDPIRKFVAAAVDVLREYRRNGARILFYGGVDLSHVGLQFGDTERSSPESLAVVDRRDREFLSLALGGTSDAVFRHIGEDRDRRRVCGFPAIFTMLSIFEGLGERLEGHLVDYQQSVDAASDCIVTYAAGYWSVRSGEAG